MRREPARKCSPDAHNQSYVHAGPSPIEKTAIQADISGKLAYRAQLAAPSGGLRSVGSGAHNPKCSNGTVVRLRDPRRFSLVLWQTGNPFAHALLADIGPEPLSAGFDGAWLHRVTRNRGAAIKHVLMDGHVVAGVGNIYANEALFRAGIHPRTAATKLSRERCAALAEKIRETLELAITAGGSSLRDYVRSDGMAGNYQSQFMVYDRAGEPCQYCGTVIRGVKQGQRSTFYCPHCQRR